MKLLNLNINQGYCIGSGAANAESELYIRREGFNVDWKFVYEYYHSNKKKNYDKSKLSGEGCYFEQGCFFKLNGCSPGIYIQKGYGSMSGLCFDLQDKNKRPDLAGFLYDIM
jgi:hypothetical protein